jgi:hypothetical protein
MQFWFPMDTCRKVIIPLTHVINDSRYKWDLRFSWWGRFILWFCKLGQW